MSRIAWPGTARPLDAVYAGYVALSGALVLLLGWRLSPGLWIGLTAAHAALLVLGLWWARQPTRDRTVRGLIRDVYPLIVIPFLYWELRFLARLFGTGYHDPVVLRLEELIFGQQLAVTFSQALPVLWVSEMFHFFYGLYWLLLPLAAGAMYARGRIEGFRELVFVETVVFFVCYLIFIVFPVAGPFYQFPEIGGALADGPLYRFVHWVLADGGSKGAAFPSSHVAVAVAILLVTWRHDRPVMAMMTPLVLGLSVGTVYGRFHYGIDAAAGAVLALIVVPPALALRRALGRWLEPGNAAAGSLV